MAYSFYLKTNRTTAGAMTNEKGVYEVDVLPGTYDVKFEFMSFKTQYIKVLSIMKIFLKLDKNDSGKFFRVVFQFLTLI